MDKADLDYLQNKATAARHALDVLEIALQELNSKLNALEEANS